MAGFCTEARTRAPEGMRWVPIATLADEALPNVMRKVIAHALGADLEAAKIGSGSAFFDSGIVA